MHDQNSKQLSSSLWSSDLRTTFSVILFSITFYLLTRVFQSYYTMTLPYNWTLYLSSSAIFGSTCLAAYYLPGLYETFAAAGFVVVGMWFGWQVSKLMKASYDLISRRVDPTGKFVLITGCSSGFGFDLAVNLDSMGYHVIAGVRVTDDERVRSLRSLCSDRLRVIRLDVTRDEEVDLAVFQVEKIMEGNCLWAVVNNAGIVNLHGVEWGPPGVGFYHDALDVNTLGVMRVTRAFLPLLRRTRGSRLVIVSSVEDRVEALTQPSYAASKFAVRAFANCVRRELRPKGVFVSVIEPSLHSTSATIQDKLIHQLEQNWRSTPLEVREAYGEGYLELFIQFTKGLAVVEHKDISPVISALTDAITKQSEPKFYYRVCGFFESFGYWLTDILPEEIIDIMQTNALILFMFKVLRFFSCKKSNNSA